MEQIHLQISHSVRPTSKSKIKMILCANMPQIKTNKTVSFTRLTHESN